MTPPPSRFDPSDSIYSRVGEIAGSLRALEDRVTRHETGVKVTLDTMDRKLDDIQTAISQQSGGIAWVSTIGKWTLWMIGGAASLAAMIKAFVPWGHS